VNAAATTPELADDSVSCLWATDDRAAEEALWHAQRHAPARIESYVPLYKFYSHRRRLTDVERTARLALTEAAAAGGFAAAWRDLTPTSADWTQAGGPARLYLFSLKALAFMRLRLGDCAEAAALLDKLAEIDPRDQVGAGVIRSLLAAVTIPATS
jgi:hypothetical protein